MADDQKADAPKVCFVIMPISDPDGYAPGHFTRVYQHLLAPACRDAGFAPIRADEVQATNLIVADILKRIITADVALCDLSARNPNVLFELGLRQAFNKPVTLVKDVASPRIFDITGLRDVEYDGSLRVDQAAEARAKIAGALRSTYAAAAEGGSDLNSLVQLLQIRPAEVPEPSRLAPDTQLLLNAIRELGDRVAAIERSTGRPTDFSESKVPTRKRLRGELRDTLLEDIREGRLRVGHEVGLTSGARYVVTGIVRASSGGLHHTRIQVDGPDGPGEVLVPMWLSDPDIALPASARTGLAGQSEPSGGEIIG